MKNLKVSKIKYFTYMISNLLFLTPTLLFADVDVVVVSRSGSSSLLSNVLSELGDFLMVIPILAFFTPSSLIGGLTILK